MKKKIVKDWLSLSRSEQRAARFIIIVFIAVICWRFANTYIYEQEEIFSPLTISSEIESEAEKNCLFVFDVNEINKDSLLLLGFDSRLANTYIKYRTSYGPIEDGEQFCKLYGMRKSLCDSLIPFATFPKAKQARTPSIKKWVKYPKRQQYKKEEWKAKKVEIVELNTADTAELEGLPGIGPVFARRILKFRELLGGFHAKGQLLEVYHLDSAVYDKIQSLVLIDTSAINRISVRHADMLQLKKHPYFSSALAKAIVRYRDQHSEMESLEELRNMHLLTDSVFYKIRPYLELEELRIN